MSFNDLLVKIDDVVWGIPTIVLILVTGLVLTIRTRGIQFTKLGRAFKTIFRKNEGHGELSGFAALCTALSATIASEAKRIVFCISAIYSSYSSL